MKLLCSFVLAVELAALVYAACKAQCSEGLVEPAAQVKPVCLQVSVLAVESLDWRLMRLAKCSLRSAPCPYKQYFASRVPAIWRVAKLRYCHPTAC